MDDIIYRIREEYTSEQISYGVEIWENSVQIEYIPNVFTEKEYAERLVDNCNKYQASPIHIYDIIENMYFEIKNTANPSPL